MPAVTDPTITVDVDNGGEWATRYVVRLPSGKTVLIDDYLAPVPAVEPTITDVWVMLPALGDRGTEYYSTIVALGDTPEDGFATFVPEAVK